MERPVLINFYTDLKSLNKFLPMLIELSIIPLNHDSHISKEIAEALKIIDESGLPYQLTPLGTCIEGEWDEVMPLVRKCHDRVRKTCSHIFTTIRIEDEKGAKGKLSQNIKSVEEKAGRALTRGKPTHFIMEGG
jgi:uncharacterized protein (TIGR00106 family)